MEQTRVARVDAEINANLEEMGIGKERQHEISQEADSLIEDARLDLGTATLSDEFLDELKEVVMVYLADNSFIHMTMDEDEEVMYCTIYSDHGVYKYMYIKEDDFWTSMLFDREEVETASDIYNPEVMPPEKLGAATESANMAYNFDNSP